ncbi:hypothetical protein [Roseofilum casamattae]|uniref:Plastid lipid-associated protein/fibrillin conserved domain-containing protein n=1 Tax=Roseofilum casamattae BLCC-M143 TaxID=3022442 RepID=A0ABT7BXQ9_9CYAN|nr:hypothetical protein [Roseofilum casamattae]MDJ1183845.1 hypothetical protein [Roseofilum casamattae BLCC-M143]
MSELSILEQAVDSVLHSTLIPDPERVVGQLVALEKSVKKTKESYQLQQLVGTWRLCFVTGGKPGRSPNILQMKLAQVMLRSIPIQLIYSPLSERETINTEKIEPGWVQNQVRVGLFTLEVSGPVKHIKSNSILAFDFTKMQIESFSYSLFSTRIRKGEETDSKFYTTPVSQQPFFNYFLVRDRFIAARGRGGGLALWGRV